MDRAIAAAVIALMCLFIVVVAPEMSANPLPLSFVALASVALLFIKPRNKFFGPDRKPA